MLGLILLFLVCLATGTLSLFFKGLLWLAITAFVIAAVMGLWAAFDYRHRRAA
jgi:hypothetical protein